MRRTTKSIAALTLLVVVGAHTTQISAAEKRVVAKKFAAVPAPGSPWGVAIDGDTVFVSTAAVMDHPTEDWRIFAFGRLTGKEAKTRTVTVPRLRAVSAMGLGGAAFDASGRLYVIDMNGRVLRVDLRKKRSEVYATVPLLTSVDWIVTMPFDLTFDRSGNLYIADGGTPVVWRVPPGPAGRDAELWFQDLALQGQPGWSGLHSMALAPDGRHLYLGMCQNKDPASTSRSIIYRLPVEDPTAGDLEEFATYTGAPLGPCPNGLAFGRSGNLYVALTETSEIQVIRRDGKLVQRIAAESPTGLALDRTGNLFISSADLDILYRATVRDRAHPIVRPQISP